MTPPRLWAVTPPSGDLAASIVDAWSPWHAAVGVWLRGPGEPPHVVWARTSLVAAAARRRGCAVVLGCGLADLEEAAALVRDEGLAGVVLRGDPDDAALQRARDALGDAAWLGRSIHGDATGHERCTFSVLGPIFAPRTAKPWPTAALGVDALARAAAAPHARIVAVGGVERATAAACVAAGAWGLAGIRSFFGPPALVAEDVAALGHALPTATRGPKQP